MSEKMSYNNNMHVRRLLRKPLSATEVAPSSFSLFKRITNHLLKWFRGLFA
jgi:hypothetical protein